MNDTLMAGGRERAEYGCIVTFRSNDEPGHVWTIHKLGPPLKALRAACDEALNIDESFRVVSFSTPETVYGDMQGRSPQRGHTTVQSMESKILGRAKLYGMLHQSLVDREEGKRTERNVRYKRAERRQQP